MIELTKNQKIFFGGLTVMVTAVICYYIMTRSTVIDYSEVETVGNTVEASAPIVEKEIVIHVTGEVVNEGIVKIKEGSRISDVIEAAGGSLTTIDFSKINLAYLVSDGQKIYIPSIEDVEEVEEVQPPKAEVPTEKEYISNSGGDNVIVEDTNLGGDVKEDGKVNINTGTQAELETLPGIGKATATKIIDYRNENGKFASVDDIRNVNGIGEVKFSNIKDKISI